MRLSPSLFLRLSTTMASHSAPADRRRTSGSTDSAPISRWTGIPCDRGAILAGLPWGHVMDGVDHWWFRDGLAQRYRADYDAQGLTVLLGLSPAPGSHT